MNSSSVLLWSILKMGGLLTALLGALSGLVLGPGVAIALVCGAAVSIGGAAGLIHTLGKLLDPTQKAGTKAAFMALLMLKFLLSFGILWTLLVTYQVSPLGLVLGLAVGLGAVVLGVLLGSSSAAGRAAVALDEGRIQQEIGDTRPESR